jgi:hypothetical protein
MSERDQEGRAAISTRAMEIVTALLVVLGGAVVAGDSFRLGARWGEDGPQAGYFPFYIGLIICLAGAGIFLQALRDRALSEDAFVETGQLKTIFVVLVPTTVYIALIAWLGFYLASTLYIAYFMYQLGNYSWLKIAPVAIGVSVVFFLIFEIWFQVPLPKGPLENALGLA